jgi:mannose-1-phosphate guanylyltransferase / mannose-6-phosphate isomerase
MNKWDWLAENGTIERVYKNWGWYDVIYEGDDYKVKILTILPGKKMSLQLHHYRGEQWFGLEGNFDLVFGEESAVVYFNQGMIIYIPKNQKHQAINHSDSIAKVLEIWMGDTLLEEDIVRFSPSGDV